MKLIIGLLLGICIAAFNIKELHSVIKQKDLNIWIAFLLCNLIMILCSIVFLSKI